MSIYEFNYYNYFSHVEQTKESIISLKTPDESNIDDYKIALLFNLINSIATTTLSIADERIKFVTFVNQFCNFQDGNRVSVPQLYYLIKRLKAENQNNEPLETYVNSTLLEWKSRQFNSSSLLKPTPILLSENPELSELTSRFQINESRLEGYTHTHLLYAQRNSLIHRLTHKGFTLNQSHLDYPHYEFMDYGITPAIEPDTSFELCCPLKFYVNLIDNALAKLPEIYIRENISIFNNSESIFDWNETSKKEKKNKKRVGI